MHPAKRAIRRTVTLLLLFATVFVGLYSYKVVQTNHKKINKEQFNGTLLDTPRSINDFSLRGIDNASFTNASLNGKWTLVFFGFTNCGYVCPTTMAELGKTYRLLESRNSKVLPEIVMISLDPERDSAERLGQYVHAFDKHFYGARGDSDAIKSMTKDLGIAYAKVAIKDPNSKSQDDIEHTGAIMLFNPKGKLAAFFTGPHSAEKMADDFALLTS